MTFPVAIENAFLKALPHRECAQLMTACDVVDLLYGSSLTVQGEINHYVYFPISSIISLMVECAGSGSLEVAMIGNEGMYGISAVMGVEAAGMHAVVLGEGRAWRMQASHFRGVLSTSVALQQRLQHYHYVLSGQLAQTAACSRFHLLEERLACWLLMTHDRLHSSSFRITHEFLAHTLGVRRVGVTKAAGALQKNNLIRYSRGYMEICDVAGLQLITCPCYSLSRERYNRYLRQNETVSTD